MIDIVSVNEVREVDTRYGRASVFREIYRKNVLVAQVLCLPKPLRRYVLVAPWTNLGAINFSLCTHGDPDRVTEFGASAAGALLDEEVRSDEEVRLDAQTTMKTDPARWRVFISYRTKFCPVPSSFLSLAFLSSE